MSVRCHIFLPFQLLVVIVVGPETFWNMDCTSKFPKNNVMGSYLYILGSVVIVVCKT